MIQFSQPHISTIVALGCIYFEKTKDEHNTVDLKALCEDLQPINGITYLKYIGDIEIEKGVRRHPTKKKKKPVVGTTVIVKKRKTFSNSCTIEFLIQEPTTESMIVDDVEYIRETLAGHFGTPPVILNTKIYSNGCIQITGAKNLRVVDLLLIKIAEIFSILPNKENIFKKVLNPQFEKTAMIMCHMQTYVDETSRIDQRKLYHYINYGYEPSRGEKILCTYDNTETSQLGIAYEYNGLQVNYYVFSTGKINITKLTNIDDMPIAFEMITKLLTTAGPENIFINDKIKKIIALLNVVTPPQKSEAWLNMRKGIVTASASQYAILKEPLYGTRDEYVKNKILEVHDCIRYKFKGNIFTRFGEMMEPIAQTIYEPITTSNTYFVNLYETGLHVRNEFVGASPDGVILKFKKNRKSHPRSIPVGELLDIYTRDNKFIIDAYLLEIKCPSNYKPIPPGSTLKKAKPNYYCQVQTQLYVCQLDYCVWMNCDFQTHETLDDCRRCDAKYKGILLKIK